MGHSAGKVTAAIAWDELRGILAQECPVAANVCHKLRRTGIHVLKLAQTESLTV
jgi:hypothetical protein